MFWDLALEIFSLTHSGRRMPWSFTKVSLTSSAMVIGRVWNVNVCAIGVEVNKQVRNNILTKRIHVRVEHFMPSRCTEQFCLRLSAQSASQRDLSLVSRLNELLWKQLLQYCMMWLTIWREYTSHFILQMFFQIVCFCLIFYMFTLLSIHTYKLFKN